MSTLRGHAPMWGDTAGLSPRTFLRCVRVRELLSDGIENNVSNTGEQEEKEICSAVTKLNPTQPRDQTQVSRIAGGFFRS